MQVQQENSLDTATHNDSEDNRTAKDDEASDIPLDNLHNSSIPVNNNECYHAIVVMAADSTAPPDGKTQPLIYPHARADPGL